MNKVDEIKIQIKDLQTQLVRIQTQCVHPTDCVRREYRSSAGNYDPTADSYWIDLHCSLCDKQWREDQ